MYGINSSQCRPELSCLQLKTGRQFQCCQICLFDVRFKLSGGGILAERKEKICTGVRIDDRLKGDLCLVELELEIPVKITVVKSLKVSYDADVRVRRYRIAPLCR